MKYVSNAVLALMACCLAAPLCEANGFARQRQFDVAPACVNGCPTVQEAPLYVPQAQFAPAYQQQNFSIQRTTFSRQVQFAPAPVYAPQVQLAPAPVYVQRQRVFRAPACAVPASAAYGGQQVQIQRGIFRQRVVVQQYQ